MTLSDALPVQFWLSSCNTYNETVPKGVHEKCFCAPWNCDDQIRVQFQEDFSPDADYSLLARDSDGLYLAELAFTELETGVHSVAFSPETEDICDEVIALEIAETGELELITPPDEWTVTGIPFTSRSSQGFTHNITSATGIGALRAYQNATIPVGEEIAFNIRVTITGTWTVNPGAGNGVRVRFFLADSGGTEVSTDNTVETNVFSVNGTYDLKVLLTADSAAARLYIAIDELNVASGTAETTVLVRSATISPTFVLYAPALAKSDCLDVKLSHDETELIEYANERNFAGLIYSDVSPDASFNIRVPCRFFHEVFPEEDEAIELTSQVVTTSGQLKSQKLLEVQHVPYYFHRKLQLVLKHQTLTINDTPYQKEEKYEIQEGNKQWPLKSATCLLTEKNSVLRNVL